MTDAPRAPLVVATSNRGKLREIRALLARSGRPVLSLADVSAPVPIVETGRSYLENAIAKAVAVVDETRLMTLADDSGLEVEALGGRPGVTSARYGGPLATDRERCARLLGELQDVPRVAGGPASAPLSRWRCPPASGSRARACSRAESLSALVGRTASVTTPCSSSAMGVRWLRSATRSRS